MNAVTIRISQELRALAEGLDDVITEIAGERLAFCLVVFTEGRSSYIANCDRSEVKEALENLIACWKADMPDVPAHEYKG